jgi:hypothetical protein
MITKTEQIQLKRFAFDHFDIKNIRYVNVAKSD